MNAPLPYDHKSAKSIVEYAKKLRGRTLREVLPFAVNEPEVNYANKGSYGQLIEKLFFKYNPNNDSRPDFPEAKLELKVGPLKVLKSGEFRAKERLVMNIIDYMNVINEDFLSSSFYTKCSHLLLIFYLHDTSVAKLDLINKLVDEWIIPKDDLKIIQDDWNTITQKIREGKAHELSEGDTFYLGACTKGSTAASSYRDQPYNSIQAKQRAYSLKQGYVNHIIHKISKDEPDVYGKLIKRSSSIQNISLNQYVISQFDKYLNKTTKEIEFDLGINLNDKAKSYFANLSNRILGIGDNKKIQEFEKADITIRTIRLDNKNKPREEISFPAFEFMEIVNESWEDSTFRNQLEKKFLFIFYKFNGDELRLNKVMFWNMSFDAIEKCKSAWETTVKSIKHGLIVKQIAGKRRMTYFPGSRDNEVCHVRPHAQNAKDTYPLPIEDQLTGNKEFTKHSFWLNANFVKENIYLQKK